MTPERQVGVLTSRTVDVISHEELLRKPRGIYNRLHELQFSPDPEHEAV